MTRPAWSGLVLLAIVTAAGVLLAPRILLAAWLVAWWWCLGVVLGSFVNAWMSVLSGGRWGEPLRATASTARRVLPWLLLGLLPLAAGVRLLYPWASPSDEWLHMYTRPAFVQAWLSTPFFLSRLLVYAAAWWWITAPRSLAHKPRAAASLLLYTFLTSLAAVDLLMSLVPGWFSTAFGLVVLSGQALSGAAAAVLVTRGSPPALVPGSAAAEVPLSRDLGNLLLMWVMSWAYLAFMQFLIIWAENLPHEVAWYVPRLQTDWVTVGVVLVLLQLVLPFLALLFRALKDRAERLVGIAGLLLVASMLDVTWMVLPSVDPHTLHGWWLCPGLFAAAALLLWAGCGRRPATASPEVRHAR